MFSVVRQLNAGHRIQYRNVSRMINTRAAWINNKARDEQVKAKAWMNQS